ncbi:Hypothetical_protein [Hexamita inflata]|uniref:Hypothetical_protein n=1 Tax=Hexamita inflata TaxID=28002 RepID=A0AA86NNI8_9EUKA|nr:Hypothetical protein HINF_LOCUS10234 [Hexamita inflata]CAI9967150.1 Hypothetical protein HINF_LOCUS54795 [Hexamita inflata]
MKISLKECGKHQILIHLSRICHPRRPKTLQKQQLMQRRIMLRYAQVVNVQDTVMVLLQQYLNAIAAPVAGILIAVLVAEFKYIYTVEALPFNTQHILSLVINSNNGLGTKYSFITLVTRLPTMQEAGEKHYAKVLNSLFNIKLKISIF